jgi:hypothetical protein
MFPDARGHHMDVSVDIDCATVDVEFEQPNAAILRRFFLPDAAPKLKVARAKMRFFDVLVRAPATPLTSR